jgi:ABC-2 type transport system ATP-binding protein
MLLFGEVGIMLEARAVHTGRSAHNHLLALAATHGIGRRRVDEVVDQVGLRLEIRTVVGDPDALARARLDVVSHLCDLVDRLRSSGQGIGADPDDAGRLAARWPRIAATDS